MKKNKLNKFKKLLRLNLKNLTLKILNQTIKVKIIIKIKNKILKIVGLKHLIIISSNLKKKLEIQ